MKTIKLPIRVSKEDEKLIRKIQCQFSSSVRFAYNRFVDNEKFSIIEKILKN